MSPRPVWAHLEIAQCVYKNRMQSDFPELGSLAYPDTIRSSACSADTIPQPNWIPNCVWISILNLFMKSHGMYRLLPVNARKGLTRLRLLWFRVYSSSALSPKENSQFVATCPNLSRMMKLFGMATASRQLPGKHIAGAWSNLITHGTSWEQGLHPLVALTSLLHGLEIEFAVKHVTIDWSSPRAKTEDDGDANKLVILSTGSLEYLVHDDLRFCGALLEYCKCTKVSSGILLLKPMDGAAHAVSFFMCYEGSGALNFSTWFRSQRNAVLPILPRQYHAGYYVVDLVLLRYPQDYNPPLDQPSRMSEDAMEMVHHIARTNGHIITSCWQNSPLSFPEFAMQWIRNYMIYSDEMQNDATTCMVHAEKTSPMRKLWQVITGGAIDQVENRKRPRADRLLHRPDKKRRT